MKKVFFVRLKHLMVIRSIITIKLTIALFLISGCVSLTPYEIEVLRPAKHTISPALKKIVLVSNIEQVLDSIPVEIIRKKSKYQYLNVKSDTFIHDVISGLYQELNARQFFDTAVVDSLWLKSSSKKGVSLLFDDVVMSRIKAQSQCDVALLLNKFDFKPVISYTEQDGFFYFQQSVSGSIHWQLIDLTVDTILYRSYQNDTLFWNSYIPDVYYPVVGVPQMNLALKELSKRMGFFAADLVTPFWEPAQRYYYAKGSSYFDTATEYVVKKNWVEAQKVWFYIYNNSALPHKARAAHNIALAKELQGQYREAGEWASESLAQFKMNEKRYADDYQREKKYTIELAHRYVDRFKLNNQIGGDE